MPHRGWNRVNPAATAAVTGPPASWAAIALCSAPWYLRIFRKGRKRLRSRSIPSSRPSRIAASATMKAAPVRPASLAITTGPMRKAAIWIAAPSSPPMPIAVLPQKPMPSGSSSTSSSEAEGTSAHRRRSPIDIDLLPVMTADRIAITPRISGSRAQRDVGGSRSKPSVTMAPSSSRRTATPTRVRVRIITPPGKALPPTIPIASSPLRRGISDPPIGPCARLTGAPGEV